MNEEAVVEKVQIKEDHGTILKCLIQFQRQQERLRKYNEEKLLKTQTQPINPEGDFKSTQLIGFIQIPNSGAVLTKEQSEEMQEEGEEKNNESPKVTHL